MDKNWHYLRQPKLTDFEDRSPPMLRSPLMPSHPFAASEQWCPKKRAYLKHHLVCSIRHGSSHSLGLFLMCSGKTKKVSETIVHRIHFVSGEMPIENKWLPGSKVKSAGIIKNN